MLDDGYLLICNVNSRTLNDKKGYSGHFVVITGYDEHSLITQDPGPPAYAERVIDFDKFKSAWGFPDEKAQGYVAIKL